MKAQGIVPSTLDTAVTAQALLAYFEGGVLLAKGRNDLRLDCDPAGGYTVFDAVPGYASQIDVVFFLLL